MERSIGNLEIRCDKDSRETVLKLSQFATQGLERPHAGRAEPRPGCLSNGCCDLRDHDLVQGLLRYQPLYKASILSCSICYFADLVVARKRFPSPRNGKSRTQRKLIFVVELSGVFEVLAATR